MSWRSEFAHAALAAVYIEWGKQLLAGTLLAGLGAIIVGRLDGLAWHQVYLLTLGAVAFIVDAVAVAILFLDWLRPRRIPVQLIDSLARLVAETYGAFDTARVRMQADSLPRALRALQALEAQYDATAHQLDRRTLDLVWGCIQAAQAAHRELALLPLATGEPDPANFQRRVRDQERADRAFARIADARQVLVRRFSRIRRWR